MFEKIKIKNEIHAIIIRNNYSKSGINFFTPNNFSMQLGYMKRPKNYQVIPHIHLIKKKIVKDFNEVLFVKKGKMVIKFFNRKKEFIKKKILKTGDIIFLCSGGHGIKMLEESEIIEVKQGPYTSDLDKKRF